MPPWKRTLWAAWTAQVLSITGFCTVLPFLPLYIRDLGVTDEAAVSRWSGIVTASAALTMAAFAPVWGVLADRYGRKPMVLRSMYGGALSLTLMALVSNVHQLALCRLLQGALTGTVTASLALVASATPRQHSGFSLGMMQAAIFVGASVGPLLGGEVAHLFGYRAAFYTAAALLLAGGVFVNLAIVEDLTAIRTSTRSDRGTFREVLSATGFAIAVLVLFMIRYADSIQRPVFPLLVENILGGPKGVERATGRIVAMGGVAAACSAGLLGRLSDRWGHKRMLIGFCIFTGLVSLVYVRAESVAHLYLLRFAFGLGAAGMAPAANAIIRDVTHDKNIGKAYGVTSSTSAIGWALGPLTGGCIAGSMGIRAPFVAMAVGMGLVAIVVACLVRNDASSERG